MKHDETMEHLPIQISWWCKDCWDSCRLGKWQNRYALQIGRMVDEQLLYSVLIAFRQVLLQHLRNTFVRHE